MSIKLIAIDIDGTLIDSNHQLSSEVSRVLQAKSAEGVKIVLCSGRPIIGMTPFVEELGLMTENQYTIGYNGSLVQHNGDLEVLVNHTLNYSDFEKIEALGREIQVKMHTLDLEKIYTPNKEISEFTVYESYATGVPLTYCPAEDMPQDMIISKMMLCEKPEILAAAIKKIPQSFFEDYHLIHSMPFFFEVLNKAASKGNALRDLTTLLGIKPSEVMAIGDNENDLDMLEFAGIGVAMGNATPNVKAIADVITKSNDENGVAYAVETWA